MPENLLSTSLGLGGTSDKIYESSRTKITVAVYLFSPFFFVPVSKNAAVCSDSFGGELGMR